LQLLNKSKTQSCKSSAQTLINSQRPQNKNTSTEATSALDPTFQSPVIQSSQSAAGQAADSGDIIYKSGTLNPLLLHIKLKEINRPIGKSAFHYSWISQPLFIRT
jgi:hypothetical protein